MYSPKTRSTGESVLFGLLYSLRPWQWYKQLVIYIAVIFSGSAGTLDAWIQTTIGALLFSIVAGSTYLLNDVSDRSADRQHPRKKHRPIASGQVSASLATMCAVILYVVAGVLSWRLNPLFFGLIALYVGQNILYSFSLKNYLFVDLFSISAGFVIRAVAGVILLSVELSPWIVLCTFLTALMLGVTKRWGEHQETDKPAAFRKTLNSYSKETLQFLLGSVATLLLISYTLYTFFASEIVMMLTIPFAFYAVFRFVHLTFVQEGVSEPVSLLVDQPTLLNFVLWGVTTVLVLYRQELGVWL